MMFFHKTTRVQRCLTPEFLNCASGAEFLMKFVDGHLMFSVGAVCVNTAHMQTRKEKRLKVWNLSRCVGWKLTDICSDEPPPQVKLTWMGPICQGLQQMEAVKKKKRRNRNTPSSSPLSFAQLLLVQTRRAQVESSPEHENSRFIQLTFIHSKEKKYPPPQHTRKTRR